MTLGPTHVAAEAFIIWAGMGKKNREIFKSRRGLFALLSLFALLPDIDTFFYIHRTYLHSIIWPLILIIGTLCWILYLRIIRKQELSDKVNLISKSIIIASMFIFLHSILDLTTGPVLLFYPLDNRLYDLDVYLVLDLDSPLLLKNIIFDWKSVSLNEGIETYFLNLTPQERIAYFGSEFVAFFISDFPLHFSIFIAWFIFFPFVAFINWLDKYPKHSNFFKRFSKLRSPLLSLGLILIIFGSLFGPAFRLQRIENREINSTLRFSEENVNYGIAQSFELDGLDSISLQANFANNNSNTQIKAIIANEMQFSNVSSSLSNLFEEYESNASLSYIWLVNSYRNIISNFTLIAIDYFNIIPNSSQEILFTLDEDMKVYSFIVLQDWNSSIAFETTIQLSSKLIIKRAFEFYFGLSIAILGLILSSISIAQTIRETKSGIKQEINEEISMNDD